MAKEPDTAESMLERARFRKKMAELIKMKGLDPDNSEELLNALVKIADETIDAAFEQAEKNRKL